MKILILGGCGFIGSHLAHKLVNEGHHVCIFDRLNTSIQNIATFFDKVELYYGDFSNEKDIEKAVKGCDVIYHLISTTFPSSINKSGVYDVMTNLIPTIKLLEIAIKYKIKHIIYLSSGGTVYGNNNKIPFQETSLTEPITLYGLSKLSIENYIKYYCTKNYIKYTILRASNVYGPKQNIFGIQGIIAVAIGNLIRNKPQIIWGDGETYRDYIYIDDLVKGLYFSLQKGNGNNLYNIGSEKMHSINEILNLIEKTTGKKIKRKYQINYKVDIAKNILAIGKIKRDFNWHPQINLKEGIEKTWLWAKEKHNY